MGDATPYVELQVSSNFSFLRGASHPEEMVITAAALGHAAVAITDRNTLAGVVRAHGAAKEAGIQLLVGARLDLADGPSLLCFPRNRQAYGRLCRLLTLGQLRADKGTCILHLDDVFGAEMEGALDQVLIVLPPEHTLDGFAEVLQSLAERLSHAQRHLYLAGQRLYRGDDAPRLATLAALAESSGIPLVATNDVRAHTPARRPLQDVLWCIREHCTVDEAGFRLGANAERHLKPAAEMLRLFEGYEHAVARTNEVAGLVAFSLDELRYEYPEDHVPEGETSQSQLEKLTWEGAARCYPGGIPDKVRGIVAHELKLIGELRYAPYFLTVHDIVSFARLQEILCQGRGSAANSAVCYCLGITAVDPDRVELLFERFVSNERREPPDIDVDFEHERREEVIQYIYQKYGRHRAGMTATVIRYRTRSALREVAKALGLSQDIAGALVGMVWGQDRVGEKEAAEAGLDVGDGRLAQALALTRELHGFPRHLSQHVGGFVLTRGPLSEVVPILNAAMPERTMVEWDKDDLDALGILKVDVLGLGMLTCIRKALGLIGEHWGRPLALADVPKEDPGVYEMLSKADSVGVFQVESRAQMSMLPRLKPQNFYDLVIEVAIVRPGPIQGDMVHPYLRRREGLESVIYPSHELEAVLRKTLGVPLFQEQAMRIAIVAAGFTPAESDGLRRAMATFRRNGTIGNFRDKFIIGMTSRGYAEEFAVRCFQQIEGFGEYGFPESHAASFALLVYVSAWIKRYYPEAFACALLNAQPMGFYAPAQIVRDLTDHGGRVLPVDVNLSSWDCTLESSGDGVALRLGFRQVQGLRETEAQRLVEARDGGDDARHPSVPFRDPHDLWRRAALSPAALERLAEADAFGSMRLSRREALWAVRPLGPPPL
ncbi:MAG: DNA polymerase III subunit alpha, partial [Alphaproteobacteria bacterium]|nr:DNA polymerase III subunit alpha [Alphaproteobacteria bacterium]